MWVKTCQTTSKSYRQESDVSSYNIQTTKNRSSTRLKPLPEVPTCAKRPCQTKNKTYKQKTCLLRRHNSEQTPCLRPHHLPRRGSKHIFQTTNFHTILKLHIQCPSLTIFFALLPCESKKKRCFHAELLSYRPTSGLEVYSTKVSINDEIDSEYYNTQPIQPFSGWNPYATCPGSGHFPKRTWRLATK